MYVKNIYTILHDFRRPVESAMIKIEITIGNNQNLKLHQMQQANMSSSSASTALNRPQMRDSPPMGLREG
jgi:hypothetical protein